MAIQPPSQKQLHNRLNSPSGDPAPAPNKTPNHLPPPPGTTPPPQDLRTAVLAEAEASAVANARVAGAWGGLFALEVPQALFAALEGQRAACEAVIASKDALIAGGLAPPHQPPCIVPLCLST